MRDAVSAGTSVEVYASAWLRWGMPIVALSGISYLLSVEWVLAYPWQTKLAMLRLLQILIGIYLAAYGSWVAFKAWRRPVLRLGPDEIRVDLPFGGSNTIPVSRVDRFNSPAPRDFWVYFHDRPPTAVPMVGISKKDRERIRAWFCARWPEGHVAGGA